MTHPLQSSDVHVSRDTSVSTPLTESTPVGGSATHQSAIPETVTDTRAATLDTRTLLEPTFGTFRLSSSCSATITSIFKDRFNGAYSTIKDVPQEEEKLWWEEFTVSLDS